MKSFKEIVKVELPLAPETIPMALVHNCDRSIASFFEITDELLEVMGDRKELFFNAHVTEDGIDLQDAIEDQGW